MTVRIRVISQQPPGGRCSLYAGYAEVLVQCLGAQVELEYSDHREAHGCGFPSLHINNQPVLPADGVIVMPADVIAALQAVGVQPERITALSESLDAPLNRMLDNTAG